MILTGVLVALTPASPTFEAVTMIDAVLPGARLLGASRADIRHQAPANAGLAPDAIPSASPASTAPARNLGLRALTSASVCGLELAGRVWRGLVWRGLVSRALA